VACSVDSEVSLVGNRVLRCGFFCYPRGQALYRTIPANNCQKIVYSLLRDLMKGNVLYGSICNDPANRIMELDCNRKMVVFVFYCIPRLSLWLCKLLNSCLHLKDSIFSHLLEIHGSIQHLQTESNRKWNLAVIVTCLSMFSTPCREWLLASRRQYILTLR